MMIRSGHVADILHITWSASSGRHSSTSTADQKWIAIEVDAPIPFTLIAIWACVAGAKRADRYIGQVYQKSMIWNQFALRGVVLVIPPLANELGRLHPPGGSAYFGASARRRNESV
jgi:hypothetical protein